MKPLAVDLFCGLGGFTDARIAKIPSRLSRWIAEYVGIELNPAYVEMSERRVRNVAPLFSAPDFLPDSNKNC